MSLRQEIMGETERQETTGDHDRLRHRGTAALELQTTEEHWERGLIADKRDGQGERDRG